MQINEVEHLVRKWNYPQTIRLQNIHKKRFDIKLPTKVGILRNSKKASKKHFSLLRLRKYSFNYEIQKSNKKKSIIVELVNSFFYLYILWNIYYCILSKNTTPSRWGLEYTWWIPLQKDNAHQLMIVLDMTLNSIWCFGSSSLVLGSVRNLSLPLFLVSLWPKEVLLVRVRSIAQIDLFKNCYA